MLFALGTIGFWILLGGISLLLIFAEEFERFGLAVLGLVAAFVVMGIWGDFNVVSEILAHPFLAAAYVGGYFAAGTVWAIIKWWFFVRDCRYRYEEAKRDFLRHHGVEGTKIPDRLLHEWKSRCEGSYGLDRGGYGFGHGNRTSISAAPQARNNKARIMRWMMFWPWSLVWTIVNDPIRKLFKRIYRSIQGLLQRMSDRAYRGVEDDFREVPKSPEPKEGLEVVIEDDPGDRPIDFRRNA